MKPVLSVKDLTVVLSGEKVIEDLSFEVMPHDFFAIIGPNGAGKTVLLKTLLGFFPHSGHVRWAELAKIHYMPPDIAPSKIIVPVTVREFFALKGIGPAGALSVLSRFGLEGCLDKKLYELSSGELQTVLLGWTVADAKGPETVLLLDEPTTGMDVERDRLVFSFLGELWEREGLTVVVATHNLRAVKELSTKVLGLFRRKVYYGPPSGLDRVVLAELYGA